MEPYVYLLLEFHQEGYWKVDILVGVGPTVYMSEQDAWDEANRLNDQRDSAWSNFWKVEKRNITFGDL